MNSIENNSSIGDGSNESVGPRTFEAQVEGAQTAFRETNSDLSEKASKLAGDAKEAVVRKAEEGMQGVGGSLKALGGALRAAGDHLSKSGETGTSNLIGEAASGVERFADSVESKPLGEVVDELRTFGRNNPGALFAGAVLTGLALGRVLKASDSDSTSSTKGSQSTDRTASRPAGASDPVDSTSRSGDDQLPQPTATSGYAS
jgi:hypothetical protein